MNGTATQLPSGTAGHGQHRLARQVLAVFVAAAFVAALVTSARAAAPPDVQNYEFFAFGNVVDDSNQGTLLFIGRGELPFSGWCTSDALADTDGCPDPTNPTSIFDSAAVLRIFTDCDTIQTCTTTGTFKKEASIRRIGHLLTGVFFGVGHGFTWGATDTGACIIAPATYWDAENAACISISWRPSPAAPGSLSDTQRQLSEDAVQMMKNLEQAYNLPPGTWVSQEKITAAGRPFALEAFSLLNKAAPQGFQAGALSPELFLTAVATSVSGLDQHLATQRASSPAVQAYDDFAVEVFGMPGVQFGRYMVFLIGFILAGVGGWGSKGNPLVVLTGFMLPFLPGMWLWVPFSWPAVVIVVLILFAAAAVVRILVK